MAQARKLVKDELKNLMILEKPGRPFPFDADREFVQEVSNRCSVKALVDGLQGKDLEAAKAAFQSFGQQVMELTIELGDGKYIDRTGEMIEKVARQTGVSFPHRLERYIELGLLGSRPLDRWNVSKATIKELEFQVSGCAVYQALQEAGINYPGLPCRAIEQAMFQVAMQKTGDKARVEMKKTIPEDGLCQFLLTV